MNQPEIRNAVVLVIDRLGTNMLGAYGSTWFETQNVNRLAGQSLVFDQAISSSSDLDRAYQRLWQLNEGVGLIQQLSNSGIGSTLLTDEPAIENRLMAESFDRIVPVEVPAIDRVAQSIDETQLAHFFAQAVQAITELEPGNCLWLHSRGLSGAWDAPLALRHQLADSEDPEPPDFYQTPARTFDVATDDPDELLGYQQVCAAQVTLIDDFLGVIIDLLESELGQSTLFCVTSPRGFPLGEHGLVGSSDQHDFLSCFGESIHVPLLVRLPRQSRFKDERAVRIGNLVQPELIADWLVDWFENPEMLQRQIASHTNSLPRKQQQVVFSLRGETRVIQTHAWKMIMGRKNNGEMACELYAKPDDRCEVNDVSRRCPQVVEALEDLMDQMIKEGQFELPPDFELPPELAIRLD